MEKTNILSKFSKTIDYTLLSYADTRPVICNDTNFHIFLSSLISISNENSSVFSFKKFI